jgi:PAP2 superfamily
MGWLSWKAALEIAVPLLAFGVLWRTDGPRLRAATAFSREASLVLVLYAVWTSAGTFSLNNLDGAQSRGKFLWDAERSIGLPSEASIQKLIVGHDQIGRALNGYYAWMHVSTLVAFLVWLFVRHRDRYPSWRMSLVLLTSICLAIQLVPVAPPRFFPELGFVDTGRLLGDSVYPQLGSPGPGQLAAMPSVHVAWAALIGWAVFRVSSSRWRGLGLVHAVLTVFVVTATANHWWLDGIVAVGILAAIRAAGPLWATARRSSASATTASTSASAAAAATAARGSATGAARVADRRRAASAREPAGGSPPVEAGRESR